MSLLDWKGLDVSKEGLCGYQERLALVDFSIVEKLFVHGDYPLIASNEKRYMRPKT